MKIFLGLMALAALGRSELIDLSYSYEKDTIFWPGGTKFHFTKQIADSSRGFWVAANEFAMAEHGGTHIDAPRHFDKNGITLEKIPLKKLFTKGVLIDVSDKVGDNANYVVEPEVFIEWEKQHGPMPEDSVVMVRTGWWRHYPNKEIYMGPTDDDLRFPALSKQSAQWLADSGKVIGLGIDTPSPDVPTDLQSPLHKILLKKGIYILENVNLKPVLPPKFELTILPMKIKDGTGGPTRIVAHV